MIERSRWALQAHRILSWGINALQGRRNGSTLVIADASHGGIKQSFAACVTAAAQLSGSVDALICGKGVDAAAQDASVVSHVQKVLKADHTALEHHLAEPMAALLCKVMDRRGYSCCIMPASTAGKNILPRAAALMRTQPITDVVSILSDTQFKRPIYAGNAIATVERICNSTPLMLTIRPTSFGPASRASVAAPIERIHDEEVAAVEEQHSKGLSEWVTTEERSADRPDLSTASVVVSGGRALKSAEHFHLIEELADALGGAVGASRAAVDAGMVANDLQVGQTGKVVAPDLYFAIGISGAIQHVAGIKDSKVIVAINSDAEAPIFSVADVGLVGDLFQVVPQLTEEIKKRKANS